MRAGSTTCPGFRCRRGGAGPARGTGGAGGEGARRRPRYRPPRPLPPPWSSPPPSSDPRPFRRRGRRRADRPIPDPSAAVVVPFGLEPAARIRRRPTAAGCASRAASRRGRIVARTSNVAPAAGRPSKPVSASIRSGMPSMRVVAVEHAEEPHLPAGGDGRRASVVAPRALADPPLEEGDGLRSQPGRAVERHALARLAAHRADQRARVRPSGNDGGALAAADRHRVRVEAQPFGGGTPEPLRLVASHAVRAQDRPDRAPPDGRRRERRAPRDPAGARGRPAAVRRAPRGRPRAPAPGRLGAAGPRPDPLLDELDLRLRERIPVERHLRLDRPAQAAHERALVRLSRHDHRPARAPLQDAAVGVERESLDRTIAAVAVDARPLEDRRDRRELTAAASSRRFGRHARRRRRTPRPPRSRARGGTRRGDGVARTTWGRLRGPRGTRCADPPRKRRDPPLGYTRRSGRGPQRAQGPGRLTSSLALEAQVGISPPRSPNLSYRSSTMSNQDPPPAEPCCPPPLAIADPASPRRGRGRRRPRPPGEGHGSPGPCPHPPAPGPPQCVRLRRDRRRAAARAEHGLGALEDPEGGRPRPRNRGRSARLLLPRARGAPAAQGPRRRALSRLGPRRPPNPPPDFTPDQPKGTPHVLHREGLRSCPLLRHRRLRSDHGPGPSPHRRRPRVAAGPGGRRRTVQPRPGARRVRGRGRRAARTRGGWGRSPAPGPRERPDPLAGPLPRPRDPGRGRRGRGPGRRRRALPRRRAARTRPRDVRPVHGQRGEPRRRRRRGGRGAAGRGPRAPRAQDGGHEPRAGRGARVRELAHDPRRGTRHRPRAARVAVRRLQRARGRVRRLPRVGVRGPGVRRGAPRDGRGRAAPRGPGAGLRRPGHVPAGRGAREPAPLVRGARHRRRHGREPPPPPAAPPRRARPASASACCAPTPRSEKPRVSKGGCC